ncbi:serine/threonine protein kinase [Nocardiopsis sp. NRRL B-16309]|uniref:serine/threonine protein kinase n=1 Tax=Nocardiopsis sp. NRRL B-16309 TaxID=1519494 RepID=UPI0006AE0487|nr:serine/threonine protein kinase [Nocardiopsis sp. NRRL B-16309]KOX11238.1 serine/threonine protein kinase [Nocardiopsis sp. NRRL B-16309]
MSGSNRTANWAPGYDTTGVLRQGGRARIVRATRSTSGADVVLKVLPAEQGRAELGRLRDLSGVPGVVSLLDAGQTSDGEMFVVLPFYPDGSFGDMLAKKGPAPIQEAAAVARSVSAALGAMHGRGLLHNDVCPGNILRAGRTPVLTGFGSVHRSGEALPPPGPSRESFLHAPPEALRGEPRTPASDVYQLASTIWTMLVGSTPFANTDGTPFDARTYAQRALAEQPRPVPRQDISRKLRGVLTRALAKAPEERFPNAAAFATAFEQARTSRPVATLSAETGGQVPSTGPQAPPTGGQAPSTGPRTPPTSQFPTTGPQTRPTGPQAPPAHAQPSPTGPQSRPAGSQVPPAPPQAPAAGSQVPPAARQAPAAAAQAPPTTGWFPPSGPQQSMEGVQHPPSGPQVPQSGPQPPPPAWQQEQHPQAPPATPPNLPPAPYALPVEPQPPLRDARPPTARLDSARELRGTQNPPVPDDQAGSRLPATDAGGTAELMMAKLRGEEVSPLRAWARLEGWSGTAESAVLPTDEAPDEQDDAPEWAPLHEPERGQPRWRKHMHIAVTACGILVVTSVASAFAASGSQPTAVEAAEAAEAAEPDTNADDGADEEADTPDEVVEPSVPPEVPPAGNLVLEDTLSAVNLTWTDNSGGTASYFVLGGPSGHAPTTLARTGPGAVTAQIMTDNTQIEYCFTVVAVEGSSAATDEVCTTRAADRAEQERLAEEEAAEEEAEEEEDEDPSPPPSPRPSD